MMSELDVSIENFKVCYIFNIQPILKAQFMHCINELDVITNRLILVVATHFGEE